jgi:AcrR family transcriptional regulator
VARLPRALSKTPVENLQLSREELSAQQHLRILDALTEVFAKRGYQAATVDHLIAAAKISMGSFYDHFEGKEDCLLQVYEKAAGEARERIALEVPESADWATQAYAGMRALVGYATEEPMAARVILLEAQTAGPQAVRRHNEGLREIATFLRQGREISALDAELPPTFEDATAGGLAWMMQARLVRGEVGDPEGLYREMAEVALEPYLGLEKTKRTLAAYVAEPA